MYKFERYGTLWWYKGLPIYAGGKLITKKRMVLWWPLNWVFVIVVFPYLLLPHKRKKDQGQAQKGKFLKGSAICVLKSISFLYLYDKYFNFVIEIKAFDL